MNRYLIRPEYPPDATRSSARVSRAIQVLISKISTKLQWKKLSDGIDFKGRIHHSRPSKEWRGCQFWSAEGLTFLQQIYQV